MIPFTYFISDLHLSADRDDINQCLFQFLSEQAHQADALYVLGDLFEVWIGDDDQNSFTLSIAKAHGQQNQTLEYRLEDARQRSRTSSSPSFAAASTRRGKRETKKCRIQVGPDSCSCGAKHSWTYSVEVTI